MVRNTCKATPSSLYALQRPKISQRRVAANSFFKELLSVAEAIERALRQDTGDFLAEEICPSALKENKAAA